MNTITKLKHKEIKDFREQQLIKQNYLCALCGEPLSIEEAVLDHCHKTGVLRGVIHRGDNILLGKIENNMPRTRVSMDRLANISKNLVKYLTDKPISEMLHPTHKTPEERRELSKKRAKARRQKKNK